MVQNVPIVVWRETHTVPGMVSPAPGTTLLESTQRGNSTHTVPVDLCGSCQLFTALWLDLLATKVRMLLHWFTKSLLQTLRDMTIRCYVRPFTMHLLVLSFLFSCFLPSFSNSLSFFHHMFKTIPFFLPSFPLQQTIQEAGCSPWQRCTAVQWAANWWLVNDTTVECVCVWIHGYLKKNCK